MPDIAERVRNEIAVCRRAGSEGRFQDAIEAADNAITMTECRSNGDVELGCVRLLAAALGYKGMVLFQLKRFDPSVLALEESYRLFQEPSKTKKRGDAPMPPLLGKVTSCLVRACRVLGRSPPLPPLVKFPRTPHLFRPANSRAVTDDDLVLSRDAALFELLASPDDGMQISIEEKIDGANLGISLSLDGEVLVQNRSHYISHGEHAQFSQLAAWIEVHGEGIRRILTEGDDDEDDEPPSSKETKCRRILYGEWMVARHSIRYDRLPGHFVAFDISENGRFVSRRRFHTMIRGSGIPVSATLVDYPTMTGMSQEEMERTLLGMLRTPSRFRSDGGPLEGIVIRVDSADWMQQRCKLVDPDFTAGITGHWAKSKIEKQRVDPDFASRYLEACYVHANAEETNGVPLPTEVLNPRQRAAVSYRQVDGNAFSATCTVLPKEPRDREGAVVLQRNLCWLWADEVLVSSTPKSREQIRAMHDALNVGLVITLTREEPLPADWFSDGCDNYFCPIADGMAPKMQEMDDIGDAVVRAVVSGGAVLEHCGGGKGRAGTVAACLLLRFGRGGIRERIDAENQRNNCRHLRPREPFMSGEEAMAEIRRRRPGSLETVVQENFVREYAQHLWRSAADTEDPYSEPSTDDVGLQNLQNENDAPAVNGSTKATKRRVPKYIVLAGLPGSRKSTLARRLSLGDSRKKSDEWIHVSTDELGGKRAACNVAGRAASRVGNGGAGGVIIDACNISASKRREWIDVMFKPNRDHTALVFFDVPVEECVARVRCRVDHPTIPFGRGSRVVESFAKNFELPDAKEGELFGQIIVLKSRDDVSVLLSNWGVT